VGNYNPDAPIILGNEWVPLRDPGFKPDNVTEVGTMFHIDHSATAVTGYYNISENVPNTINGTVELVSVYPAGQEDDTGPIQQVTIPVSSMSTTGSGISGTVANLQNPADDAYVVFTMGDPSSQQIGLNFDVAAYQAQLQGKRILNVEVLIQAGGTPENLATGSVGLLHATGGVAQSLASDLTGGNTTTLVTELMTAPMGDMNLFWNPSAIASTDFKAFPWRWEELNNLSMAAIAGNRLVVRISLFNPNGTGVVNIGYVALRVTYCEERRVLYGGDSVHPSIGFNSYAPGPRPVQLLTPAFAAPSALSPGDYTVTLSHRLYGDSSAFQYSRTAPRMYGVTEYQGVSTQRGRLVRQSLTVGDTFTVDDDDLLPQLTLHTTSGIITGSHPYGDLIEAPVYGSITAAQVITNLGTTGNTYPQVRFYARHFGATVPLRLTSGAFVVEIPPITFDALPEIADGWREVTLQFTSPPTGTQVGATWTFSATNETAGTHWEILATNGVSPSAPQTINAATYQAPSGGTQTLTWKSPNVTGATADGTGDAVLMFSQDPPTVTGVAVTESAFELSTMNDECGIVPNCSPTALSYLRVTWSVQGAYDVFDRIVADGLGTTTGGQTYSLSSTAADYDVNGDEALITMPLTTDQHSALTPAGQSVDMIVHVSERLDVVPSGGSITLRILGRATDFSNYYEGQLLINTSGSVTLSINRRVGGVGAVVNAGGVIGTHAAGDEWDIELYVVGSELRVRAWKTNLQMKPLGWQITATDANLTTGTLAGFAARRESGNTDTTTQVVIDDFTAVPIAVDGGQLEVQRRDEIDTDWETVVLSSVIGIDGFNDFEARVGVTSDYRVRLINSRSFVGSWSATGSDMITTPGVTGGGSDPTVLLFTSNQDTDASLAYTMTWDGRPVETFAFPETNEQTFQRLYGRDFQVAFRPLERGGEQFDRVLLVQAASVTPTRLANMTSLRDLAWADLPYVCVRDELGNRWYANVLVPLGSVENRRRIFLAQVRVTEVTDTPAPVGQ